MTGITSMNTELAAKRLGLIHELLPQATRFAVLVASNMLTYAPVVEELRELRDAVSNIGGQIEVLAVGSNREIQTAFADLVQKRIQGLVVSPEPLFGNRVVQFVTLATRHAVAAIYPSRMWAEAGGLMIACRDSNVASHVRPCGIGKSGVSPGNPRTMGFSVCLCCHQGRTWHNVPVCAPSVRPMSWNAGPLVEGKAP